MTTKKILVKTVLMSMLTVATFTGFTSCQDDDLDTMPQQEETAMTRGGTDYNPNDVIGPAGFNATYWRTKEDIYLYTGKTTDVASGLFGYVKVPLPWNETVTQANLPMNFCKEITPENGWQLVMNNCGNSKIAQNNFFALYNKYLGILRFFYYMPANCGNGNDHYWNMRLSGDMAYRTPMLYSLPQDVKITKPAAFGLKGVTQNDDMTMYVTPWTQTDITNGSIVPRQGWWAFDLDLSTYRPDVDITDNKITLRADEFNKAGITLYTALTGSLDGSMNGQIDLNAQYKEGNKAAKVCGTVFKALQGAANVGKSIASFITGDVGDGIGGIADALGSVGDICADYGQDELSGFSGTMNASINLALKAEASSIGSIQQAVTVGDIVQPELNIGKNFDLKKTGLGKGVWSLKSSPKIYMTNITTDLPAPIKFLDTSTSYKNLTSAGCVYFFDPSSIEVDLNPEVFGNDVEWMRVDAVCLVREGTSWETIDKYRSALGLKDRTTYMDRVNDNVSYIVHMMQDEKTDVFANAFYNQKMPKAVKYPTGIMHDRSDLHHIYSKNINNYPYYWGAGNSKGKNKYIIEPQMAFENRASSCMAPPAVVDVVVTVKLKGRDRTFVYSGEYLPEIDFLPLQADNWVSMLNRVKNNAPSYYKKYPDHNPTYKFHMQHMEDKMKAVFPNKF